jgi:hypothetical protein
MKQHLLVASLAVSALLPLAGCAAAPPAAAPEPADIGRAAAVDAARQDAAARFRVVDVTMVSASRSGRYWVVDLVGREGGAVHYAIASDGSIRERRVLQ